MIIHVKKTIPLIFCAFICGVSCFRKISNIHKFNSERIATKKTIKGFLGSTKIIQELSPTECFDRYINIYFLPVIS